MPAADVPVLVQHMALAIFESGYGTGSKDQRFYQCLNVARWRLVEYGFLRKGSQHGSVENIVLTAKGQKRNAEHFREGDRLRKFNKFSKLYEMIDTEAEKKDQTDVVAEDVETSASPQTRRQEYKEKLQRRRAALAPELPAPQPKKRKSNKIKVSRARRVRRAY